MMTKYLLKSLRKWGMLALFACVLLSASVWDGPEGLFALPMFNQAKAEDAPASMDGSTIDGVQVSWVTQDSTVTAEGEPAPATDAAHLYLSTNTNSEVTMVYRIDVQLSGQNDYKPGEITISIPAQVFHTRMYEDGVGKADTDSLQGTVELPVPEAPSTKADFNWQLIGDQYVLTNTRTIGATSSVSIEVGIGGLTPMDVVDMSVSEPIKVECEVTTSKGNIIRKESSNALTAQIDTEAHIKAAHKGGEVYESAEKVPADLLGKLPTNNPEDYIYVRWYTYQAHQNNQPYSLTVQDKLSDVYVKDNEHVQVGQGLFLGFANVDDCNGNTAVIGENLTDVTDKMQYDKTVYMWSAYPKNLFENGIAYCLDNTATWVLTETDNQKTSSVDATASVMYTPAAWTEPVGSFNVVKWTEDRYGKDWNYGLALNQLNAGKAVDMNFHVQTVGYGYPWTKQGDTYGVLGWTQVTEDSQTFFNYETTPLTAEDVAFKSLRIAKPTMYRYGKLQSGGYDYVKDDTLFVPTLKVEVQKDGGTAWQLFAQVQHKHATGFSFTDAGGAAMAVADNTILFPADVTAVRWSFTSNVAAESNGSNICDLAGIAWNVYPTITLKPSTHVKDAVAGLFAASAMPATKFQNNVTMSVLGGADGNTSLADKDADVSRATLAGAGYGVSLRKTGAERADTENRRMLIRYTATLTEQSNLQTQEDYLSALEMGAIPAETSGIWYDLLPEHVVPLVDTVTLRDGDTVTNAYVIENYQNTGRYLLVVEAKLTPVPRKDASKAWFDAPVLSFDAAYSLADMERYGTKLVNYVAFESTVKDLPNGTLGTFAGQQGEPDTPAGGMNVATPSMPEDIVKALTNLDPNTDENRFVYGRFEHTVEALTYAISGLDKSVRNDLAGAWTQGLAGQEQVTVYEGHRYTYQLRVSSRENTATKGIIIYDELENYEIPADGTKQDDYDHTQACKDWKGNWYGKGQWRGRLEQVDLSEFIKAGVAPVLYYSTQSFQFPETKSENQDGDFAEDTTILTSGYYDVTNQSVWTKATPDANGMWTVPEDISVGAIAIDATTDTQGEEFILAPKQALAAYLKMRAPDDEGNPDKWNAKGAYARMANDAAAVDWVAAQNPANNMYAFNNTRVRLIQGSTRDDQTLWASTYRVIRNDYTRVGIVPSVIVLEKVWEDQDNHDNLRPASVTVSVLRKTAGEAGEAQPVLDANNQPMQVVLSAPDWKATLLQMDMADAAGQPYLYTFVEEEVPGYECVTEFVSPGVYRLKNIHPNELVEISGKKIWQDNGNAAGARPAEVQVQLYRDNVLLQTQTIRSNGTDAWTYTFDGLEKYEQGGREYVYTVKEVPVADYQTSVDKYDITNTYDPYGDLSVTKTVTGAVSDAAKDREFTFTLALLEKKINADAPDVIVEGKFAYRIFQLGADGVTWAETDYAGQISSGDTFVLKDGQKIVIEDLPSGCRYEITEKAEPGYTAAYENASGVIVGGALKEAAVTNTYRATGSVQLKVGKQLTGAAIQKNKFKFELVDMNAGSTYNTVIATTRVQKPEKAAIGGLGEAVKSEAEVLFGALKYTQEDHGKTFYYEIREVDEDLGGYQSDSQKFRVKVTVFDKSDGTLTVTPTFVDVNNNPLPNLPVFKNKYTARGSLILKAWKTLVGRELQEGEFTFKLYEADSKGKYSKEECIATAMNDEDGNIVFDSFASFTQDDVSLDPANPKVCYYLMKEQAGEASGMIYSGQTYLFKVTVRDNGDGTLAFDQEVFAVTEDGVGTTPVVPVFTNHVTGDLVVEKKVEGENAPDQEFTFHVKLTGEEIQPDYTVEVPSAPQKPEDETTSSGSGIPDVLEGQAYAVYNSDTKELIFFRSINSTDIYGNSISVNAESPTGANASNTLKYYYIDENTDWLKVTNEWLRNADIASVKTRDNITLVDGYSLFNYLTYLSSVDLSKLDTRRMISMYGMFMGCSALEELDIRNFDTSNVIETGGMFSGCAKLKKITIGDNSKFSSYPPYTGLWMKEGDYSQKPLTP